MTSKQRIRTAVLVGLLVALCPAAAAGQDGERLSDLVDRYRDRGQSGTPLHVFLHPCEASNRALGALVDAALRDDWPSARLVEVTGYLSGMRSEDCPDPRVDGFLRELVRRTPPGDFEELPLHVPLAMEGLALRGSPENRDLLRRTVADRDRGNSLRSLAATMLSPPNDPAEDRVAAYSALLREDILPPLYGAHVGRWMFLNRPDDFAALVTNELPSASTTSSGAVLGETIRSVLFEAERNGSTSENSTALVAAVRRVYPSLREGPVKAALRSIGEGGPS